MVVRRKGSTLITFRVRLADEGRSFGTRIAGRALRTKCSNLLTASAGTPLVIDWGGVTFISSSFADEFIGKLFVELGPLNFSARVRNVNVEPFIQSLVEKAISQRVAQGFRDSNGDDE